MFAKTAIFSFVLTALTSNVLGSPLPSMKAPALARRGFPIQPPSFNNYPNVASLNGFDNFYGVDNFDGSFNQQTVVKDKEVVCHSESVTIIQQRLAVIQEIAKKVVTELICDVETQTVVFEQWYASISSFGRDIQHLSSRQVGYDSSIVSHFPQIIQSDGSCSTNDFGFSGSSIGSSLICPSGFNWDDSKSPSSVGLASYQCGRAIYGSTYWGGLDLYCDSSDSSSVSVSSSSSSSSSESCDSCDDSITIDSSYNNYNTYDNNYNTYSTYENNYYNTYDNSYNTYGNNYNTYENNYYTTASYEPPSYNYNTYSSWDCEGDDCGVYYSTTTHSSWDSYQTEVPCYGDSCSSSSYSWSCEGDSCDNLCERDGTCGSAVPSGPIPSGSASVVPSVVPSGSAKIPAVSASVVPTPSAKVPVSSAKVPVSSAKVPVSSAKVPVSSAKVPATSAAPKPSASASA